MRKLTLLFLSMIFSSQVCLGETAQEIIIPGYSQGAKPSPPSHVVTTNLPVETFNKPMSVPATEEELEELIQPVDLSGWLGVANYLWTCTPRYFTLPMYNSKNEIQARFNQFKKKKKILTMENATQIASQVGAPLSVKIPGLSGIMCRMQVFVTNVEKPYTLNCLFIMLDTRYLSRLVYDVSQNNGKPTVVPKETVDAIDQLFATNCVKQAGMVPVGFVPLLYHDNT